MTIHARLVRIGSIHTLNDTAHSLYLVRVVCVSLRAFCTCALLVYMCVRGVLMYWRDGGGVC